MAEIYFCPLCGMKLDGPDNPEIPYVTGLTFYRSIRVCPDCLAAYQPQIEELLAPQWDSFISGIQEKNLETIPTNQESAVNAEVETLQSKIYTIQTSKVTIETEEVK